MRKYALAIILALLGIGSASASTVNLTNVESHTVTGGTNFNIPLGSTSGNAETQNFGNNYYELVLGAYNALTTFTLVDTNPEHKTVAYSLYEDTNSAINTSTFDNAAALYKGSTTDVTGSLGTIAFSYLLKAGKQYVLDIKPSGASTSFSETNVSAVPLPAAVWLFGSALFGFVAVSNRRRV